MIKYKDLINLFIIFFLFYIYLRFGILDIFWNFYIVIFIIKLNINLFI